MSAVEMKAYATGWPDEAVLDRVRAGETALYEVLVRRHNLSLRRVARRVLANEADVDEVVQETHYSAFCALHQFAGRSSFSTWLTQIAIHAALNRLRRPARSRELSASSFEHDPLETAVSHQPDPEEQLQDKEALAGLAAAVRALPEPYRTVFFLRKFRELSTAEVAHSLRISEQCAKTRLHRARLLLGSHLKEPIRMLGRKMLHTSQG